MFVELLVGFLLGIRQLAHPQFGCRVVASSGHGDFPPSLHRQIHRVPFEGVRLGSHGVVMVAMASATVS